MTLHRRILALSVAGLGVAVSGCGLFRHEAPLTTVAEMTHSVRLAAKPAATEEVAIEAIDSGEPRRVRHPQQEELWPVTRADVMRMALERVAIIRDRGSFLSPGNSLLNNPEGTPSAFDSAIAESGGNGGGRGVDAALSDFDTTFAAGNLWGRNELIQNNRFLSGGLPPGATLTDETSQFTSRLERYLDSGGRVALSHNWNYSLNNAPNRLFGSNYIGLLQAEYRQPLLAGFGSDFTDVSGPLGKGGRSGTVGQGVAIARINTNVSLTEFETRVQTLLKNVEDLYWDLVQSSRAYEIERASRDDARKLWEQTKGRVDAGLEKAGAADEAQAREYFYERSAAAEDALTNFYQAEGQLRRLIGLPVNDGKFLHPVEEPMSAEFSPDWRLSLAEALTRRRELRRQQLVIKSLNAQCAAAKSLVRPQMDFVSAYRLNGFGDDLFGGDDAAGPGGLGSAYETLARRDQTGWNLGFEFSVPLGLRAANAQVRNLELRLAKARAALKAQETEISHELSNAFQNLDRWYSVAEMNHHRLEAAHQRVKTVEADYRAGRSQLDLLLRARLSEAQSEAARSRSLAEYNKAIAELHYRKATLLEHHNIELTEGSWNPAAYANALKQTWNGLGDDPNAAPSTSQPSNGSAPDFPTPPEPKLPTETAPAPTPVPPK